MAASLPAPRHRGSEINCLSAGCLPEPNAEACYLNFKITFFSLQLSEALSITENWALAAAPSPLIHFLPGKSSDGQGEGLGWG